MSQEVDLEIDMDQFPPLKIDVGKKRYDYMPLKATYLEDGTVFIEYKRMPYFMLN